MISRPTGRFPFLYHSIYLSMTNLIEAYREYLDRMIEVSQDLVLVDQYTVPQDVDIDSPTAQEWASFV